METISAMHVVLILVISLCFIMQSCGLARKLERHNNRVPAKTYFWTLALFFATAYSVLRLPISNRAVLWIMGIILFAAFVFAAIAIHKEESNAKKK